MLPGTLMQLALVLLIAGLYIGYRRRRLLSAPTGSADPRGASRSDVRTRGAYLAQAEPPGHGTNDGDGAGGGSGSADVGGDLHGGAYALPTGQSGPIGRLIRIVEQGIALLVVLLLVVGAALVLFDVGRELVHELRTDAGEFGLTELLSQALLVLMIAEIISSVAALFEKRVLDAAPLLVIGIIASIRRLLVISAEAANFLAEGLEIPMSMLIELGILTVAVGIFAWSIRQVEISRTRR
jgi:uncharacterized membrane protein (DUF373 family)